MVVHIYIYICINVADLPLNKMTKAFGEALGNWLGEVVRVDVEKDGFARGSQLRFKVKLSVYEPLVRGGYILRSQRRI